jgi:hypothetical protein
MLNWVTCRPLGPQHRVVGCVTTRVAIRRCCRHRKSGAAARVMAPCQQPPSARQAVYHVIRIRRPRLASGAIARRLPMRVAVLGAGGMEALRARLAKAGHDVVLVARGAPPEASCSDAGVTSDPGGEFALPITAVPDVRGPSPSTSRCSASGLRHRETGARSIAGRPGQPGPHRPEELDRAGRSRPPSAAPHRSPARYAAARRPGHRGSHRARARSARRARRGAATGPRARRCPPRGGLRPRVSLDIDRVRGRSSCSSPGSGW